MVYGQSGLHELNLITGAALFPFFDSVAFILSLSLCDLCILSLSLYSLDLEVFHSQTRHSRVHLRDAKRPTVCEVMVMPHARAHLGRRSWVGRHRHATGRAPRPPDLLRGRVLHRHRERRCVVNATYTSVF